MQYTLMLWHADHVNFGRLLAVLESELARLHDARAPEYQLMLDILYYIEHYADALHHPKEDLVFARIAARDADAAGLVAALARQHADLRAMSEALQRELNDVMNGSIVSRARIADPGRAYVDALRKHVYTEETRILPLADRLLTDADWEEIDAETANFEDPVFGVQTQERYAALRQRINRAMQEPRAARQS
jgi:hemerythrin-like domain-containing protein